MPDYISWVCRALLCVVMELGTAWGVFSADGDEGVTKSRSVDCAQ